MKQQPKRSSSSSKKNAATDSASKKRKLDDETLRVEARRDDSPSTLCKEKIVQQPSTASSTAKQTHVTSTTKRDLPFDHKYILAPMVGASELAFRLLCRKYGAQAAYTPMMASGSFEDAAYRNKEFQTIPCDRPLVCHFAANRPDEFASAAKQSQELGADAVDLNLGCPQRTAFVGHFGSYLLDKKDRDLLVSIVKAGVDAVAIPILVKIRLLDTYDDTKELVQQLHEAGASLVAIHARYRATWDRKGPGARDGPAMLEQVQQLRQDLPHVRLITNGNVITFDDVEKNLELTQADGVMSAEGILDNPALYLGQYGTREESDKTVEVIDARVARTSANVYSEIARKKEKLEKKKHKIAKLEARLKAGKSLDAAQTKKLQEKDKIHKKLQKIEKKLADATQLSEAAVKDDDDNADGAISKTSLKLSDLYQAADDKVGLAREYLELVRSYPTAMRTAIFHTRRMCKQELVQYQALEECLACTSVDEIDNLLARIQTYQQDPSTFAFDKAKAQREKEALARKKEEEGKRKRYEERMKRKAKREGKDLEFYLKQGAVVPTKAIVKKLSTLEKPEQIELWKKNDHSQHCLAFHLGTCTRARACAFLHMDTQQAHGFKESDEVAG